MKLLSFLLAPIVAVVVYLAVKNLNLGTVSSNALITVLAAALFTALLYISQSGRSEGSLKTQNEKLKEEKSELKEKHREEIAELKKKHEQEMSELKKQYYLIGQEYMELKEQTSKKPLTKNSKFGYYVDESGNLYCPPCYENSNSEKRISLKLCGNEDYGWECPICKNIVKKPGYRPPTQSNSNYNPFDS